jgi:hypothetical protein
MARDGMGLDYIWNRSSLYIQKQARMDPSAPENTGTD